ncbi:MAG: SCO family protein [Wenzhouxiangella sp.]
MSPLATGKCAAFLLPALLGIGLAAAVAAGPADGDEALSASQAAIGNRVADLTLIDTEGTRHSLHELLDRPVGISLIFTACAHSCSVTTRYLDGVVQKARKSLGEDSFRMLSIGFDFAQDTPEAMAQYARRHGVDDDNWLFTVAADRAELERLIEELGFVYSPSPRGFDHTVQLSLIDRDGQLYRQVYGETFDAPQLVEPLKDLVWRRPPEERSVLERLGDRVRLFCTVYDARGDRYYFDYSLFMGIIAGGAFLLLIGGWTTREMLRRRRTA